MEVTNPVRNVMEKEESTSSSFRPKGRTVISYDDIDDRNVDEANEKEQQNPTTKIGGITSNRSHARLSTGPREHSLSQRPRPAMYRKQRQAGPMAWQANRRTASSLPPPPPLDHSITTIRPQYNSHHQPINSDSNLNNPAVAALAAAIIQAASDSGGHVVHNNHQLFTHPPSYSAPIPLHTYPPYVHTLPAAPIPPSYPVYQDTSSAQPPYFQSYMLYPSVPDYHISAQTPYNHQRQPSVYPNQPPMNQSTSQYYNPYR